MSWDEEVISLEIRATFFALSGGYFFDRLVDAVHRKGQQGNARWSEHSHWWNQTTQGRRYQRERAKKRYKQLRSTVVAVRGCVACGKPFELTAYRQRRGHDRACSPKCKGSLRRNIKPVVIDGVSKPLSRWAEAYGINIKTVWARIASGWDEVRALRTPQANRGQAQAQQTRAERRAKAQPGVDIEHGEFK